MVLNEKNNNFYEQKELEDEVEREILETYIEKAEIKQSQINYVEEDENEDEHYE